MCTRFFTGIRGILGVFYLPCVLTITEENNTEGREAVETLIYITAKLSAVELCGILNNNNNNNNNKHSTPTGPGLSGVHGGRRKKKKENNSQQKNIMNDDQRSACFDDMCR